MLILEVIEKPRTPYQIVPLIGFKSEHIDFEIIDEDIRDTYDYEWGDVTEE